MIYRLPAKNRILGSEMRGRLQKLGLIRESGHEHFDGSGDSDLRQIDVPIVARQMGGLSQVVLAL